MPPGLHTFLVMTDSDLQDAAASMVRAALSLPAEPPPRYSSSPAETAVRVAAARPSAAALPALLGVAACFCFYTDPSLLFLTFTASVTRELAPDGVCLHLSVSARGLLGPCDPPPEAALARIAAAFSPEMRLCPPEGVLSFVRHFRCPSPP